MVLEKNKKMPAPVKGSNLTPPEFSKIPTKGYARTPMKPAIRNKSKWDRPQKKG